MDGMGKWSGFDNTGVALGDEKTGSVPKPVMCVWGGGGGGETKKAQRKRGGGSSPAAVLASTATPRCGARQGAATADRLPRTHRGRTRSLTVPAIPRRPPSERTPRVSPSREAGWSLSTGGLR